MKISRQWLAEWVTLPSDPEALAERLTMAGLEVDGIEPVAPPLPGIVVARIVARREHPNAERLSVCDVELDKERRVQVVCGAPNAAPGLATLYAPPGAQLGDGRHIKETQIRGVDSTGMLCSEAELGLGDDSSGLIVLPPDAQPGVAVAEYLQLDDHTIDIDLTPNRGDCLSVVGIAREISAWDKTPLPTVAVESVAPQIEDSLPVEIAEPRACARYVGRVIRDVAANTPTPRWMVERLRRAGVRSVSAVVDTTNYVMLELGQPLHGFDLERLDGGIRVRNARPDETLELLDGQSITMAPDTLAIADHSTAVALAGVMGGAPSGVSAATTDVYLESAYFDAVTLAGVARRYRLHSDASHRFERGVDFTGQERAIERATALIMEICGGRPGPTTVTEHRDCLPQREAITFDPAEIPRVLGINTSRDAAREIFTGLQCQVESTGDGHLAVSPPPFRFDLSLPADLLEEIARLAGYDAIPATMPNTRMIVTDPSTARARDHHLRDVLVTQGYFETISYSFIHAEAARRIAPAVQTPVLANPLSADMAVMRPSLWPGLLAVAKYNLNRQATLVRIFELGTVFTVDPDGLQQPRILAGLAFGQQHAMQWSETPRDIDFYDIKQDVTSLLYEIGCKQLAWQSCEHPALHPGQAASISVAGVPIGRLGVLHPRVAGEIDIDGVPIVFEIELERLPRPAAPSYTPISRFPAVRRDINIVLAEDISAAAVLGAVEEAAGDMLRDLQLFDVYRGQSIDSDKKSLAMGLIFQAHSSTLTDEEIEATVMQVLARLSDDFGATLRK